MKFLVTLKEGDFKKEYPLTAQDNGQAKEWGKKQAKEFGLKEAKISVKEAD